MAYFDRDYDLAVKLQAKFNKENSVRKKEKIKKNVPVHQTETTSIVDPVWETTDPTPDIHALFIAFNKRFFWGSLDCVEVCWSARMTSCAGVCVYENRNGFCSVRLSAPLLKLRPRSDLVETLLHEMIHAYLFVTKNDRDRDGHGPIFQYHMHRINKEAGTKISIYHSFHEEVKLYQQHWWRCDGPCQTRKPYFGFVKRSMNRAPGPNDIWWTDHQATCGGKFIKIKEPEKSIKNTKERKKDNKLPNSQITGYFKSTDSPNTTSKNKGLPKLSTSDLKLKDMTNNNKTTVGKNIFGLIHLAGSTNTNYSPPCSNRLSNTSSVVNNIVGYKDLTNSPHMKASTGALKKTGKANNNVIGSSATLANRGSGTLVVTSKQNKLTTSDNQVFQNNVVPFSGNGYVLGTKSEQRHASSSSFKKANLNDDQEKKRKVDIEDKCPICQTRVLQSEMTSHFDSCFNACNEFAMENTLNMPALETDPCSELSEQPKLSSELDDGTCQCPICNANVSRLSMNTHFEDCIGSTNVFNDSSTLENDEEVSESESNKVPCPCCNVFIEESEINQHLDACLNQELLNQLFDC